MAVNKNFEPLTNTSFPECGEAWKWSYNSLGQNPCSVAASLEALCFGGEYVIDPLQSGHSYNGPLYGESNSCQCNTVVYSLVSACGACQGSTWITWSQWSFNCSDIYAPSDNTLVHFHLPLHAILYTTPILSFASYDTPLTYRYRYPNTIPYGTRVPHWAYLDVITADTWNATSAEDAGDYPEVSPTTVSQTQASSPTYISATRATSTTPAVSQSPHFNRNKLHARQIVPIVVSVIGAAMLITIIFVRFRRRHRRAEELPPPLVDNKPYMAEAGDLLLDYGPSMPIQYYDPSDPNTFPQPIMFRQIPAAQTTQSGESGDGTNSAGTNASDRTRYSGLPLV
ncbi:hypothetical protein BC827DRAFT_1209690 [Russula dissimulans]|nr:hypothetical protein BC827DRAFT_1209690 [Russula dissimulans]